jgi:glutamate-5-semialdehyde dehydrogenase
MNKAIDMAKEAREASYSLAIMSNTEKNQALDSIANAIWNQRNTLLEYNMKDVETAKLLLDEGEISEAIMKRLQLDNNKIKDIIEMVKSVARLDDPIGKTEYAVELDEGMELYRVTSPIGVVAMIFESRPDALSQIASLCLKSGNCVLLKGGSETKHSNEMLFSIIRDATPSMPKGWIQLMETREDVRSMLKLDEYIDLVIPRGSNSFVKYIQTNTNIPVLGHADGVCHIYVDKEADIDMAVKVCYDSKIQYPSVCNAVDMILVHKEIADIFLPVIIEKLNSQNVEIRGDSYVRDNISNSIKATTGEDLGAEYLDYIVAFCVVESINEAINHINRYGSHHTDAIITMNGKTAASFMGLVDSASVFWNASTRFADGYRYGLGSEVGISTGKIHARGPTGLEGLTIYKYYLKGNGNIVADYTGINAKKYKHTPIKKEWKRR